MASRPAVTVTVAAAASALRGWMFRAGQWLEQPPPYDFEAFLRSCGTPRRLDAPTTLRMAIEGVTTSKAPNLDFVRLGLGRLVRLRGRERDQQVAVLGRTELLVHSGEVRLGTDSEARIGGWA